MRSKSRAVEVHLTLLEAEALWSAADSGYSDGEFFASMNMKAEGRAFLRASDKLAAAISKAKGKA